MVHLSWPFRTGDGTGVGEHRRRTVVDLVTSEYKPLAKIAKDTAAGAVLIAAIMAAIAGLIIFVPKGLVFLGLL